MLIIDLYHRYAENRSHFRYDFSAKFNDTLIGITALSMKVLCVYVVLVESTRNSNQEVFSHD